MLLVLVLLIARRLLAMAVADDKGHNGFNWFLAGVFLGPAGLIAADGLGDRKLRTLLMADGGNVEVVELDGPIVKVRLQGACGSCPSSTMTLKMGIKSKMREAIPEVRGCTSALRR